MCCLDCGCSKKSQSILDNADKVNETMLAMQATAKKFGLNVQDVFSGTGKTPQQELTPETNFSNVSMNKIYRLKGIF